MYIKLLIYIINIFNYMNSTFNLKTKNRKEKIKQNTLDSFHTKKIETINNKKKN